MRLVESQGFLEAGLLEYNTRQIGLALGSLRSGDEYARTRATSNLRALQAESARLKQSAGSYGINSELSQQLESNLQIQQGLDAELQLPQATTPAEERDNRSRLGDFYRSQAGSRANEIVNQAGQNFQTQLPPADEQAAPADGQAIDARWLAKNRLDSGGIKEDAAGQVKGATKAAINAPAKKAEVAESCCAAGRSGDGRGRKRPSL